MNSSSTYTGHVIKEVVVKDIDDLRTEVLTISRQHKPKLEQQLLDAVERVEVALKDRTYVKDHLTNTNQNDQYALEKARENEYARLHPLTFWSGIWDFFGPNRMPYIEDLLTEKQIWARQIDQEISYGLDIVESIRNGEGFRRIPYSRTWLANDIIQEQIDLDLLDLVNTCEDHVNVLRTYLDEFATVEFHAIEFEQPLLTVLAKIKAFIRKCNYEV